MSKIEMLKDHELETVCGGLTVELYTGINHFGEGLGHNVLAPSAAIDLTGKTGVMNAFGNVKANVGDLSNLAVAVNGVVIS